MAADMSFDVIIIATGTAVCVLANRLSEADGIRILILEAGANLNEDPLLKCPGASRSLLGDPKFDWQFVSEPQV